MTVDELETITGERGHSIRKHVEILKEHGLVFEHEEGFTVSEKGKDFSRSRWA